ncbi:putative LRR receptor-like serine/threonine-protein kinase [Platanthera guangdongensis]|uniref:LRR receptor-like serine/threonine-protein kinase n=1 Tax=Platanthera guangdongensis TaxID=2320717 RepID=A0ABR2MU01_9ASPA
MSRSPPPAGGSASPVTTAASSRPSIFAILAFPAASSPTFLSSPRSPRLDLSANSIDGSVPPELNQCRGLRHLNLSHNMIDGEMNLTSLVLLDTLDVSVNRIVGRVSESFPWNCGNLVYLNISSNNFTGGIGDYFDGCGQMLRILDVSLNRFVGEMWEGFWWLTEFWASDNKFTGMISPETFPAGCNLETLDLSGNGLSGNFPSSIGNCSKMTQLNIWGNLFTGGIPSGIGSLSELTTLLLGSNRFNRELPTELLNCAKLVFLDLSRNNFRGEIQTILGNFTSLNYLLIHSNSFSGGIEESGILRLPNLLRLDLAFNNFSRQLPIAVAEMPQLEFLMLANNDFYGEIPPEYGRITTLQALDVSFNRLIGRIPAEIGNLTSLLWLMLEGNKLTGGIPPEIGNCSSLLWLNLANNLLSGPIPPEISLIGRDPSPTFNKNRLRNHYSLLRRVSGHEAMVAGDLPSLQLCVHLDDSPELQRELEPAPQGLRRFPCLFKHFKADPNAGYHRLSSTFQQPSLRRGTVGNQPNGSA